MKYSVSDLYSIKEAMFFEAWRKTGVRYDTKGKKRHFLEPESLRELNNWSKGVELVQKAMQWEIAQRGIAIETNPSSNFMIGTFSRYEEHPITTFFNEGLTLDYQKLQDSAQMWVSINTDDQGVFDIKLENEYALIARALEKQVDSVVCIQTGKRTRCILRRTWNRLCHLYGRKLKDERNQLHPLRSIRSRRIKTWYDLPHRR